MRRIANLKRNSTNQKGQTRTRPLANDVFYLLSLFYVSKLMAQLLWAIWGTPFRVDV